jgi:hypothetical protein
MRTLTAQSWDKEKQNDDNGKDAAASFQELRRCHESLGQEPASPNATHGIVGQPSKLAFPIWPPNLGSILHPPQSGRT